MNLSGKQILASVELEFGWLAAQLAKHPKTYSFVLIVTTAVAVSEIVAHHVF